MSRPRLLTPVSETYVLELAKRWPMTRISKEAGVSYSTIVRTLKPHIRFERKLREVLGRALGQNSTAPNHPRCLESAHD